MPATFKVYGPFKIPRQIGKAHRFINASCPEFWAKPETARLAGSIGCYLFAIKAAKGYRPIYVGKTARSFQEECFTYHKISEHYQRALADTRKGTPVLFLVLLDREKGRVNRSAIDEVESFLIQNALAKNPDLSNVRGTKEMAWSIRGVIRSGKGKASSDAKEFRKAMGL